MKKSLRLMSSSVLAVGLAVILFASIIVDIKITVDWRARLAASEKAYLGNEQARAIANAIEQYCLDFPAAGTLENSREWVNRLAGRNPKGIQYLKVDKYRRDAAGRLLDPCGTPWIIDVPGSPGFQQMVTPQPPDEFQVKSAGCPGFASGHRNQLMYPRS